MTRSRPALALLAALVAALLSGCISDTNGPTGSMSDPSSAGAPSGSQAGSASSHGQAQRADGPVSVEPEGSQFVARQTVTVTNDFGGASSSSLTLKSFNGGHSVGASSNGGYQFRAELYGRGSTEEQAREALEALDLAATDALSGGTLTLSFVLTSGDLPDLPLPVSVGPRTVNNGGGFTLLVPPQPGHAIDAGTTNGGVHVEGLHGPSVKAESTNGGISVDGAFGEADAHTTNGGLHLAGTFNDVKADSTNGGADLELRPTRSGRVEVQTTNGGIHVEVPASGAAYDVTGDTTNGDVEIDLGGKRIESEGHATYRSPGFASAAVQVTIVLESTNSGISVED